MLNRRQLLSGGESTRIVVLTAASGEPEPVSANYLAAFQQLGVTQCLAVDARNLEEANHAFNAARLLEADGIFIGTGAVTLLDGRRMVSNHQRALSHERLELLGVRLHLLPAGNRYGLLDSAGSRRNIPPSLAEALGVLVAIPPMRD